MIKFKNYIFPAATVIFMIFIAAAIILYQRGYYDFVFIPRETENIEETSPSGTQDEEISKPSEETSPSLEDKTEGDNISNIYNPGNTDSSSITQTNTQSQTSAAFKTTTSLKASGYTHSSTDYDKSTHVIARVNTAIDFKKTLYGRNGEYALTPHMGYIIYDDGANKHLLGINGVVSVAGIDALTPTYLRDSTGHPLFSIGDKYYYVVDNSNEMVEVEINPLYAPSLVYDRSAREYFETSRLRRYYVETVELRKIDAKGNDITDKVDFTINEAVKMGKDINDPDVFARLNIPEYTLEYRPCIRWGYVNTSGEVVIEAQYHFASEFDENGYAVVAGNYGIAKVINTRGSTVLSLRSRVLYPEERSRRPVTEDYHIPETFGLESIGMFSFDHGLMRVRYMQYDYYKEGEMVRDIDILIYTNGEKFPIPADYTLKGYNNGVLLLEKDGKYGFMDYTGKWIAQPIYTYAQPFLEGLAVIGFTDGKKAVIDTEGNIVIPFNYSYISNVSCGVITAYSPSEGWTIFNKMSK